VHSTLPRKFYADSDFYRQELERFYVFALAIGAGRADQIPNRAIISCGRWRRIGRRDARFVRRHSGAASNVCRHRGTRICEPPEGHFVERIQCPYHRWTYDLTAVCSLRAHAPEFCKGRLSIHGRRCCSCGTACLHPSWRVRMAWRRNLRFAATIRQLANGDLRLGRRIVYDVKANWKLIILNFNECLHCPTLHPASIDYTTISSGQRVAHRLLLRRRDGIQRGCRNDERRRNSAGVTYLRTSTPRSAALR
jgi:Rieske 2Fe-2S family protein